MIKSMVIIASMAIVSTASAYQTPWLNKDRSWVRHTIDASSQGADGVKIADVNGDGLFDVVTGWEEGGVVHVYVHPGVERAKSLWPRVMVGRVPDVEDAMFIDAGRNGRFDIISATEGDNRTMYLHESPPNERAYMDSLAWETRAIEITRDRMQWMFAIPFDIQGDGTMEVVAAGKNDEAEIGWLDLSDSGKTGWYPLADVGWVMSIISVDFDRDDDLDIVYSDRKGAERGIYVILNDGKGSLAQPQKVGEVDAELMFMTIGDLDNDGQDELAVATREKGVIILHREHDGTWMQEVIAFPELAGSGKGVAIGDLTGNGTSEIVVTTEHAGQKYGVYYLQRNGEKWHAVDIGGIEGTKYDRIELLDLDGDGDLDVLTCEEVENLGVIWYENPGSLH